MTRAIRFLSIEVACCVIFSIAHAQQNPTVQQKADRSACSNIVALTGNVSIHCSALTPEQSKALQQLRSMLRKMLANQIDPILIGQMNDKLDEIKRSSSQPAQVVNAPNGIGSIGGTLINPQVNNFGPPPAHLTYTEEVTQALPSDGKAMKQIKLHIHTDRAIPGAVIGVIMSGPFDESSEFYDKNNPSQIGSGSSQVDRRALTSHGIAVPNSFALSIGIPAAFNPGVDLVVPLQSTEDIHVLQVVEIRQ